MAYEPAVVSAIKREIARKKASPRVAKALTLAGITESGLQQSKYSKVGSGDRDSVGFLQQRPSQGWGPAGESASTDADQFLSRAMKLNAQGFHGSAGQLAQAVQRSAFPGRYDQHSAEADQILKGVLGSTQAPGRMRMSLIASQPGQLSGSSMDAPSTPSVFDVIARYNDATQASASNPLSTDSLDEQLQQSQSMLMDAINRKNQPSAPSASPSLGSASFDVPQQDAKKIGNFEGTKVAGWIEPALTYAREHGWKGQVTSGLRTFADQTRIYNSGVRPAAKPGTSNHEGAEFPRGAVDVSDAPQLAAILANSPYGKRLKWAGAKDPVHFSHPHNGSY